MNDSFLTQFYNCLQSIVRLLETYRKWIKTITTDNGSEFFRHEYITKKLGVKVYFADPHAHKG